VQGEQCEAIHIPTPSPIEGYLDSALNAYVLSFQVVSRKRWSWRKLTGYLYPMTDGKVLLLSDNAFLHVLRFLACLRGQEEFENPKLKIQKYEIEILTAQANVPRRRDNSRPL